MASSEPIQKVSEASTNNVDLKHSDKVIDSVVNNAGVDKTRKRKKAERKADDAARGIVKPPKIKRSKAERKAYNLLNPRAVKVSQTSLLLNGTSRCFDEYSIVKPCVSCNGFVQLISSSLETKGQQMQRTSGCFRRPGRRQFE